VKHSRIILVLGPRRAGKTSVLLTFLHEYRIPHILLDTRKMTGERELREREFMEGIGNAIRAFLERRSGVVKRLREHLQRLRGVEVSPSSIKIAWGVKRRPNLGDLLETMNDWAAS